MGGQDYFYFQLCFIIETVKLFLAFCLLSVAEFMWFIYLWFLPEEINVDQVILLLNGNKYYRDCLQFKF